MLLWFFQERLWHQNCSHNLYTDPVLCLDVLCELDLFWILPWKSQVQLALWAGKGCIGAFSFHLCLVVARLTIQTPPTLCVSFPSPGGTSSPSLSTCSTHFSLSPGTYMTTKVYFERYNICLLWRKKYSHVSALHVIHHSTLPWLSWWGPKWVLPRWAFEISSHVHRFVGGGQAAFGPFLNSGGKENFHRSYSCQESTLWCTSTTSALHSVPGCSLTSGGRSTSPPSRSPHFFVLLPKTHPWNFQLVQFVMVFFHAMQPIFFQCDFPLAARSFPNSLFFSKNPWPPTFQSYVLWYWTAILHPLQCVLQEDIQV